MHLLFDLFLTFFKIGLFTFGGGYAMIAIVEKECVEKKKWITQEDMFNITVVAESTPGPVAINCATFVGYKQKRFLGALVATIAMVIPSFLIIFTIANLLDNFLEIKLIANAFKGIKIGVGILITQAAIRMMKKLLKKATNKTIPVITLICSTVAMICIDLFSLHFSTISLLLLAGAIHLLLFSIIEHQKRKSGESK